jgi:hypothetical protein
VIITSDENTNCPLPNPRFKFTNAIDVIREVKLHIKMCSRAWIGLGEGKFLLLKDECQGISTYCVYEEGSLVFYDQKGGSQTIRLEDITEIAGY